MKSIFQEGGSDELLTKHQSFPCPQPNAAHHAPAAPPVISCCSPPTSGSSGSSPLAWAEGLDSCWSSLSLSFPKSSPSANPVRFAFRMDAE